MPMLELADVALYFRETGDGPPCLVLHGGGFDHTFLSPWMDGLASVIQLVYFDQRHHGRSGRSKPEALSLAVWADDAEALRQKLNLERVHLIGHSTGAHIALAYALRYPTSVRSLVLLNPFPAWVPGINLADLAARRGASQEILAAFDFDPVLSDEIFKARWKIIRPLYFAPAEDPCPTFGDEVIYSREGLFATFRAVHPCNLEAFRGITSPTLVATGAHDFIATPEYVHQLAHAIPGSTIHVFQHSGHFPYIEERQEFTERLAAWFRQSAGPAGTKRNDS